ncbi:hypothetical protein BS47DRAFT_1360951 [Hydnum rufescens UP504]|uniref:Uncharacterized protein n=1 Tax=Hydnum rufescens UP504 TaxID=1448309 RepID=A0A9P6B195_9AGAM|nr:hypothetical protein BS47DRAFT_1360951 [Hydnum rufescens UP504]
MVDLTKFDMHPNHGSEGNTWPGSADVCNHIQLESICHGMVYLKKLGLVSIIIVEHDDWKRGEEHECSDAIEEWIMTGQNTAEAAEHTKLLPSSSCSEDKATSYDALHKSRDHACKAGHNGKRMNLAPPFLNAEEVKTTLRNSTSANINTTWRGNHMGVVGGGLETRGMWALGDDPLPPPGKGVLKSCDLGAQNSPTHSLNNNPHPPGGPHEGSGRGWG